MATVLDQARCRCRIPTCAEPVVCFVGWWDHGTVGYRWGPSCYQHVPWGATSVNVVYTAWVELRSAPVRHNPAAPRPDPAADVVPPADPDHHDRS